MTFPTRRTAPAITSCFSSRGDKEGLGGLDTTNLSRSRGRVEAAVGACAAFAALLAAPAPALAHEGHHETLTLTEQVRHLLTQPDHVLAFAGLVALGVVGTWTWRRAKARK